MGEDFFTPWMSAVKADDASNASRRAANLQAEASDKSLELQTKAYEDALALQKEQFAYQKSLQQPFFETGKPAFDAYAKEVMTSVAPDGSFTPKESEAYKWQMGQAEKNNSRTLRALGRENSSYGMGEQFKSQQNLAANEYDKQLARLADLTNIARGGASSLATASSGYTNAAGQNMLNQGSALSDIYTNQGNNAANATLAGGMLAQNSLYNTQQNMGSLANLGLKAYDAFKSNGSSGSSTDSSGGWSTTSGDYGDDSYNGDGQLWD